MNAMRRRRFQEHGPSHQHEHPSVHQFISQTNRSQFRSFYDLDHIVEYQLMVEALGNIPEGNRYSRPNWRNELMDFFDHPRNLRIMDRQQNLEKGNAIRRYINDEYLIPGDQKWINKVKSKWIKIRDQLSGFQEFVYAMDDLLEA